MSFIVDAFARIISIGDEEILSPIGDTNDRAALVSYSRSGGRGGRVKREVEVTIEEVEEVNLDSTHKYVIFVGK